MMQGISRHLLGPSVFLQVNEMQTSVLRLSDGGKEGCDSEKVIKEADDIRKFVVVCQDPA